MKILVIGNGFDLEHDLPTRYWDFMKFIEGYKVLKSFPKEHLERLPVFSQLNKNIKEYLLRDEVLILSKHSEVLKELDSLISENVWLDYFSKKTNIEHKGWIDFESEISYVIKSLEYLLDFMTCKNVNPQKSVDNNVLYNDAYNFLSSMKDKYVTNHNEKFKAASFCGDTAKEIIKELIQSLNSLIRCLEIYLEEVVGKIDIEYKAKDIVDIKEIDKVLSFNYTNTYHRVYEDKGNSTEYDYIHGKADMTRSSEENNMVLGIDEYLKKDERDNKLEFIQFKKYFQRIYKKTGCVYKNWISEIKEKDNINHEVFILGHSLDVTDKDVLREIIMNANTTTTIFYYDKNVYAQQIENLVKVITQDELIACVYGPNPKIIFRQQQFRVKI